MIKCDRCGREMLDDWRLKSQPGDGLQPADGGNCSCCGDNLCTNCAGEWDEDGVCEKCRYEQIKSVMNEYEAKHPEWVTKKIPECGTCRANPICNMGVKPGDELCIYKRSIGSDTEQGRKDDAGKLRFDLVPWRPFEEVVKVLGYGADRYGDNNWEEVKPFTGRYSAALMRHYSKWAQGERLDAESGLPHLAHMICDGLFLLYKETQQHGSNNDSGTN